MNYWLRLLPLLLFSTLYGELWEDELLDNASSPSAYVYDCVNVITGSYVDSDVDLILPGPEPLVFRRSFSTANMKEGPLGLGWGHNYPFRIKKVDLGGQFSKAQIEQPGGSGLPMLAIRRTLDEPYIFYVDDAIFRHGLTNAAGGEISAKTNHRNMTLTMSPQKKNSGGLFTLTYGDGTKRFYNADRNISYEILPNGNRIEYRYDPDQKKLVSVVAKNSTGTLKFGSFSLREYDRYFKVTASNGQVAKYHKEEDPALKKMVLRKSEVPGRIPASFAVQEDTNFLIHRHEKPNGRYLDVLFEKKKKGVKDFVYSLRAPAGKDGKSSTLFRFTYDRDNSVTKVKDAYSNLTEYHYNKQEWLTSVARFEKDKIYSTEVLDWINTNKGEKYSNGNTAAHYGFLKAKGLKNPDNLYINLHTYDYDIDGNVTKETVFGNLSGDGIALFVDQQAPGVESCYTEYTYSNDGFNLKLSASPQEGLQTYYSYLPNTNLLTSKLSKNGDHILAREFLHYDDSGFLINSISDDGSSEDENNLSNVQVRKRMTKEICYDSSSPAFCLPVSATEEFYDFDKGQYSQIRRVEFEYGKNQKVSRETLFDANDQFVFSIEKQYDDAGNIVYETDATGIAIRRTFDENKNLIYEKRDGNPFESWFTYDKMNRCLSQTKKFDDGTEKTVTFTYDIFGRKLSESDTYGNITEYTYDAFGRNISKILPKVVLDSGEIVRPVERKEYDLHGNISAEIDAAGNRTEIVYNIRKNPVQITYPDGTVERNVYSLGGKLLEAHKKNGSVITYAYDQQGRVIKETTCSSNGSILTEITRRYSGSLLMEETDSRGISTYFTYDGAGRKIKEVKSSSITTYNYDSLGRVTEVFRWLGDENQSDAIVEITVYDLLDQVIEQRTEDLNGRLFAKSTTEYDNNGKPTRISQSITDSLEAVATKTYNDEGDPISYIDPEGNSYYIYYINNYINDLGQKVKFTGKIDPKGYCDQEEFNALNIPAIHRRLDPNGNLLSMIEFKYDITGNQTARIESVYTPLGVRKYIVEYAYDNMGHKISEIEQPQSVNKKKSEFLYDSAGRLTTHIRPDGIKIEHTYDELDRVMTISSSDGSIHYVYRYYGTLVTQVDDLVSHTSVSRTYDDRENILEEQIGALSTQYTYDDLGRMTTITTPDQGKIAYEYDGASLASVIRYDSIGQQKYRTEYKEYDLLNRPHVKSLPFGLGDVQQEWNLVGRKIKTTHPLYAHEIEATDSIGKVIQSKVTDNKGQGQFYFEYDDYYQLSSEKGSIQHTYEYDSLRNRVVKDGKYQKVNDINQLLDDQENKYAYDSCGNMIKMTNGTSVATLQYDPFGRLTEYTRDGKVVHLTYDAFHRIIKKEVSGDTRDQYFFYLADHELGSVNSRMELQQFRAYCPLENQAIAIETDGVVYAPLYDCNGNLTTLLSVSGKVIESIRYTAFGEVEGSVQKRVSPYGYADKRYHSEMDLVSIGRRFYQPATGRWITPDPIGFTDSANLYMYTHNNPFYFKDPSGLFSFKSFFKAVCKIVGFYQALHTGEMQDTITVYHQSLDNSCRESYEGPNGDCSAGKIGFVNGVMTSHDEWNAHADRLSQVGGGCSIGGVYSESHWLLDFLECDFLFWLADIKSVLELRKELTDFHETAPPDQKYLLFAHSRGAIVAYVALKGLPAEVRERVIVRAYAPAKYIPDNLGHSVVNYVTNKDFVPWFQHIFSYPEDDHYTIQKVKSDAWLFDHSFNSESFAPHIVQNIEKFQQGIWDE